MILQKEIRDKAREWKVSADIVDKDYVLGHFLSVFMASFYGQLVFKGGTCLRKCYFEDYRFSEDLDFSAIDHSFILDHKKLQEVAKTILEKTGIQFIVQVVKTLTSNDILKGYQVNIKYWGANHSKNQRPLPAHRWHTKIKVEVSTKEFLILPEVERTIHHQYSDQLVGVEKCKCYSIDEIVVEKLRAFKQRSYTAPRDFYDIYYLTKDYSKNDWDRIVPVFLEKMKHKNLEYNSPEDLIDDLKINNVKRAWKSSIAHQLGHESQFQPDEIIQSVVNNIKKYLPNGQ